MMTPDVFTPVDRGTVRVVWRNRRTGAGRAKRLPLVGWRLQSVLSEIEPVVLLDGKAVSMQSLRISADVKGYRTDYQVDLGRDE